MKIKIITKKKIIILKIMINFYYYFFFVQKVSLDDKELKESFKACCLQKSFLLKLLVFVNSKFESILIRVKL